MKAGQREHAPTTRGHYSGNEKQRRAVGYIRVSTDMQAVEGLSLEAQQAAIEGYCAIHEIKLVRICKDVISGGKDQRPGLQEALGTLQRNADILIVLKFDRLPRSINHFCELYERYFKTGEEELVAIRESILLDSSLGRTLVSILLVFAQMEREATGERTREAVLAQLLEWGRQGIGISEMATRLNAQGRSADAAADGGTAAEQPATTAGGPKGLRAVGAEPRGAGGAARGHQRAARAG